MRLGRYHEAPSLGSLSSIKNKSYGNSFGSLPKNPQYIQSPIKLPSISMNRSSLSMNRSSSIISSTNQRNTKNRLKNLENKLEQLKNEIHNERMDAKQILNNVEYLKIQFVEIQIPKMKDSLKKQIQGVRKLVNITKVSNQNRTTQIRKDYNELCVLDQNESIKNRQYDGQ